MAVSIIVSVEGVLNSFTRTTEPPRLVVLKVFVVAHVPSADPAASCGWYSEALMLCMIYINRLLLDTKQPQIPTQTGP